MILNQIILGDCLEVMPSIPDSFVDMIFCDLPYGVTRNTWDSIINMDDLWTQYRRIIKPDGVILLFGQGLFSARLMLAAPDLYRYTWIWRKNKVRGFLNAKKQPLRNHEDLLVFYKQPPLYIPQKTTGHKPVNKHTTKTSTSNYGQQTPGVTGGGSTERYPTTVQDFPVLNAEDKDRWHPTQKPVALAEYFIRTYTKPGDLVLDNACGSGALLVAAKKLDRNFLGIEANSEYKDRAEAWLNSFQK